MRQSRRKGTDYSLCKPIGTVNSGAMGVEGEVKRFARVTSAFADRPSICQQIVAIDEVIVLDYVLLSA